jgi:uncharacterized membrane protein
LATTVAECAVAGDIPWVDVSPTSGSTPSGASSEVTVTFDATGLAEDAYEGLLCVSSNDATTPMTVVPLTLTVVPVAYGVEVAAVEAELSGEPGTSVEYTVWITNTGNAQDTFDLMVSGNSWDTMPSMGGVTLGAGESASVMVTVDIPGDADDGDMDAATFTATSQSDGTATASVDLTTTAVIPTFHLYLPYVSRDN